MIHRPLAATAPQERDSFRCTTPHATRTDALIVLLRTPRVPRHPFSSRTMHAIIEHDTQFGHQMCALASPRAGGHGVPFDFRCTRISRDVSETAAREVRSN